MRPRSKWGQVLDDSIEPFDYDTERDAVLTSDTIAPVVAPLVVTDGVRALLRQGRIHRGFVVLRDGVDGVASFDAARALVAYGAMLPCDAASFSESSHAYRLTTSGLEIAAVLAGDA